MRLDEAVEILRDSVLHTDQSAIQPEKLHRAILSAGNEFVRRTACSKARATIALSNGTAEYAVSSTITGFTPDWFLHAYIGHKEVAQNTWRSLKRRYDAGTTPTGQPTELAFDADATMLVYPQPTTSASLVVTYRRPFVVFTPGVGTNPTLNIPDEWAYDVIWWGARSRLLMGLPNHTDAPVAAQQFEALIQDAVTRFNPTTGRLDDRNTHPSTKTAKTE